MNKYIDIIFNAIFNRNTSILAFVYNSEFESPSAVGKFSKVYYSKVGKYSSIGDNCIINNTRIGNYCSIAMNVKIGLGRHPINFISTSQLFYSKSNPWRINVNIVNSFHEYLPVEIGNDVWIGANVIILDGVKIGDGAIIAAGALVHRNVKSFSVVGGNPAEFLFYRFDSKKIALLKEIKWWDYSHEHLSGSTIINLFNKQCEASDLIEISQILNNNKNNHTKELFGDTNFNDIKLKGSKTNYESNNIYRICSHCIMDTSDPNITFDERGWCDYCRNYYDNILNDWHPDEKGEAKLMPLIEQIKKEGKDRDHDCLIGLSGGVDSSYVTWLAKEKFGLRPMLFHVDAGWNSQEAVNNIQRLVDGLGLELYTEVVNWEEMKDLQVAFFKAQVPHIDTPQDHAFFAALYNFAAKHKYKYILTGANFATECVREPLEWHYHASDLRQLKDIHRKFGKRELKTFPLADIFKYKLYYRYIKGVQIVKPLNHVKYIKEDIMQQLADRFGWQKYPYKHYESRFTRFYEGYWLPKKFGYQKHRAHFSSLILTGQMTRIEALAKIAKPAYDQETIMQDFEYIAKKLDLTVEELQKLMKGDNKTYRDYKNNLFLINLATQFLRLIGVQKSIIR